MSRSCAQLFNKLIFRSISNRASKRSFVSVVGNSLFAIKNRPLENKFQSCDISYFAKKRQVHNCGRRDFGFTSSRSTSTMVSTPEVKALVEKLIKDNQVMLFSKSYCPFCNKVKAIFKDLKVVYKTLELDLEKNGEDVQMMLLEKTGQKTVPNTFIDGQHMGGASDIENALKDGQLQMLLSSLSRSYDYDLFVIGGGSGGLACSKEAVEYGAKVAVADFVTPSPIGTTWGLGGTCVNVGCIPKKLMHQSALLGESISDAQAYGWEIGDDTSSKKVSHNWGKMVNAIQDHIGGLNWGYKVQLRSKNVKYYNSLASLVDKNTVKLTNGKGKEETVTAQNIVLAVGGRPIYPDVPNIKENCITSDDLFSLPYKPGKTLVCGASYISLECAGFLHGLGFDVTVMVRSIFLRGFDQEMANKAAGHMGDLGIKFLKGYTLLNIERLEEGTPGKIRVTFKTPEGESSDVFNTVLVATGRKPCTEGIGLDKAGVYLNSKTGFVITDDYDKTNVENIYAVGDVADGKPELTPVAIQAGRLLAKRLFANTVEKCDYTNVPTTVFTPLEYGACGYSEEDAISKFGEEIIEVYHSNFTPLEATVPYRLQNGCYAKVITNKSDNYRVIGIHVLGPNAGEVIQGFSIALKLGATKADLDILVGIHPTNAEVFTTLETTKRSGESIDVTGC